MRNRRLGLTLVELLVVVAIIAILMSMLLPAIVQARSAARKGQCEANLKQLAQATQSFHQRTNRLPLYWGAMSGGGGDRFGGWLLHLLPDLDQPALYDQVPITSSTSNVVYTTVTTRTTGRILPAIPPTDPYVPGEWQWVAVGTAVVNGAQTTLYDWQLVGRVGHGGLPERPETITIYSNPITVGCPGVSQRLPDVIRNVTLPFLNDAEDPGLQRTPATTNSGSTVVSGSSLGNMQLTNYLANAHVFTKFGPRWESGTMAGLYPSPGCEPFRIAHPTNQNLWVSGTWHHGRSGTAGPVGRTFGHVGDGLTNTILFAEGMRQCDNLAQYRAAFYPTYNTMNEHGFGIECTWRNEAGAPIPFNQAYGNTLMFQTMPTLAQTNPLRVQALHGPYLMVAMADGSTRAISSSVARREPIASNASGRENFGTKYYDQYSRGSLRPDEVWDMLMVPNDPASNVLKNSGEIGREGVN